ncbi:hypothetical protein [Dactylosporangium sp. NPDC005555]|uniref:LGFP repeat-containing protein n=1 Tax=Dactylosporangium sp. NPDC005555 TaxID=3154889 RepID=UPI0033B6683F
MADDSRAGADPSVLSRMPVRRVVPILRMSLDGGRTALTLDVLGRVSGRSRRRICGALSRTAPWIAGFPRARDELLAGGTPARIDRAATSPFGTEGFGTARPGGVTLWSDRFGAHAVTGALLRYHRDAGGTGGRLGFPAGDASGTAQEFEGAPDTGPVTVRTSARGTFAMPSPVVRHLGLYRDPYDILGGTLSEAEAVGPSPWGTTGVAQRFERGLVVAVPGRPALLVAGRLLRLHERLGGFGGGLGFPLTGALRTVTALPGGPLRGNWYQVFEGDRETGWGSGLPGGGAMGVAPDGAGAAIPVSGPIWDAYCDAGGFDGRLGFPVAAARGLSSQDLEGGAGRSSRVAQVFQGGAVLWSEEHDARTVSRVVWERIVGDGGPDAVGWPVADQRPSPDDDDPSAYQQEFEHGTATVRDGIARIWRS